MKFRGGRAHINGVSFYSEDAIAFAKRMKDGTINVEVKKSEAKSKKDNILTKIGKLPFVRGIVAMLNVMFMSLPLVGMMIVLSLGIAIGISYVIDPATIVGSSNTEAIQQTRSLAADVSSLGVVILFALFLKFSPMGKYHGAEHKVVNTYLKQLPLTLENVKKESCVAVNCGTNLVVFIVTITTIFAVLGFTGGIANWFAISCGYEVFMVKNKTVRKILSPFYWIGGTLQRFIFTSEPTKEQIEVSIASIQSLIKNSAKKEDFYFSEEEINAAWKQAIEDTEKDSRK